MHPRDKQENKEARKHKGERERGRNKGRKEGKQGGRMDWPVRRVVLPWQAMLKKGKTVPSDFSRKHRGWNVS